MTENKPFAPGTISAADDGKELRPGTSFDPGQTRLMPPLAATAEPNPDNVPGGDSVHSGDLLVRSGPAFAISGWFKKLSQPQIIWISFSIISVCLVVFLVLIMQGRQKNKIVKLQATDSPEATGESSGIDTNGILKNKLARPTAAASLLLTNDEFAGKAPMAVRAGGPVISEAIDPELAALVDALKIRLKVSGDSKAVSRGKTVTTASKGDYRGFKISVDEISENQKTLAEEITVTTPQKGFIHTKNGVLESIKGSDLASFSAELQNAGLEIIKHPSQPGDKVFQVQFNVVGAFGKTIAADLLISGKSIGKISLAMPTPQLEAILLPSYIVLKRKVLVNDVYYDVYKVLDQSNEPLFFVYENKGRVWGVSLISEVFRTEKGIGIGSSLGNLRINYPRVFVGISDKNTPFVKIDGLDGLFILQSEGIDIKKRVFPNQTKIISILVGNSLEFE